MPMNEAFVARVLLALHNLETATRTKIPEEWWAEIKDEALEARAVLDEFKKLQTERE